MKKILVANRGEIAVRVMRTCREMGLPTVAIYSEADRAALHVRYAEEAVCVGPPPSRESYLNIARIMDAARQTGADAIHPGYGFLSERADFARAVKDAGLTFIGPPPEAMEAMGEKTSARRRMMDAGVPVVPGTREPIESEEEALAVASSIGFPVMLKAAAGGGGKGMRLVASPKEFASAFRSAKSEAQSAFGDGRVYIEKAVEGPRHIEIQVFADTHGNCVWLGERECSVQRRHQKVIEESPSPLVDAAMREAMGAMAVKAALAVGYVGAGTIECLADAKRNFWFLEMNTRLQVEHPVTELCTGLDLVRWQIEVARGAKLPLMQHEIVRRGHAVEARVYAEDPARNFMPSPGLITYLRAPGGPGVRTDQGIYAGYEVPRYYDPMIAKINAWAPTREQAIARLDRALSEYVVKGITTNIPWLRRVLALPEFRAGEYDTGLLARAAQRLKVEPDPALLDVALMAAAVHTLRRDEERAREFLARRPDGLTSAWKMQGRAVALRGGGR